jgi:predicted component of type VI protein secretion system
VVQVSLFPLASTAGFEKASIEDLLGGAPLTGAVTGPVQITVAPGDAGKKFADHFPGTTAQIGVVANFYRAPDDPEGERRQIVPAKCGFFPPTLTFTAHNMLLK